MQETGLTPSDQNLMRYSNILYILYIGDHSNKLGNDVRTLNTVQSIIQGWGWEAITQCSDVCVGGGGGYPGVITETKYKKYH